MLKQRLQLSEINNEIHWPELTGAGPGDFGAEDGVLLLIVGYEESDWLLGLARQVTLPNHHKGEITTVEVKEYCRASQP